MIHTGDTIVYKHSDPEMGMMFYWCCGIEEKEYIFFNWYGDPYRATSADYWRMTKEWFEAKVKEGTIEIYDCLPLDKYGDIFEAQAIERNSK